jgi:hypothetical protein
MVKLDEQNDPNGPIHPAIGGQAFNIYQSSLPMM